MNSKHVRMNVQPTRPLALLMASFLAIFLTVRVNPGLAQVADAPTPDAQSAAAKQPVAQVANMAGPTAVRRVALPVREILDEPISSQDQPFDHALRWARAALRHIQENLHDYTCMVVMRERVNGRLSELRFLDVKVRHERPALRTPFSVYAKFLAPESIAGREVLYVEGENGDRVIARKGGRRFGYLTVEAEPHSPLAMKDSRYPITDFGIESLVVKLIEVAEREAALDDSDVRYLRNAKVDGRACTGIEVTKRVRHEENRFYRARVFIDDELQVPIHFETFDWPSEPGESPPLLEQYTYRNLKFNVGLTDEDFSRDNPSYHLRRPSDESETNNGPN